MLMVETRPDQEVLTLTGLAVCHEVVTWWAETPVAPWCVHTLVLTGVPHLALIDICGRHKEKQPQSDTEVTRKQCILIPASSL